MKSETKKFVKNNLDLLETVSRHGSPSVSKMAKAFLLAYYEAEKKRKRQRRRYT